MSLISDWQRDIWDRKITPDRQYNIEQGTEICQFACMKLSSTSALVLLWAGREHLRGVQAGAYLKQLDLEEGRSLYVACNAICAYYAEVIRNRKYGVRALIEKALPEKGAAQIVVAGAGLDPLGIDLAESCPNARIFEVDRDNMEVKKRLYADLSGNLADNPIFVTADLSEAGSVQDALCKQGWDPAVPTVLVFEGISYYLSRDSFRELVEVLNPAQVVCEYLKPDADIAADRRKIPEEVFSLIARECALPEIQRYHASALEQLMEGMRVVERWGMTTLEKARSGTCLNFPTEESGWIEVSLLDRKLST